MPADARITALESTRREAAVAVLARAFRDNPLDVAVIGGDPARRLASVAHGMRVSLRSAERDCLVLAAERERGGPVGVLLAVPPGRFPLDPPPLLAHLRSLLGQGLRASTRWGTVYRALEAVHPLEPHWYLSLLGVDPDHQGRGVGRALLRSFVDVVDRDGLPSYLETDREKNLAFYAGAGFSLTRELRVLGTPVWCLERPPPQGEGGS